MSNTVTIGGDRLGAGKKQKAELKNYERSTHDLSIIGRTTMSAGTLVPFMAEIGLPGDTFDINLNADVLTLPAVGPLFGSMKVQMDVFVIPFRLYQGALKMNQVEVGLNMADIKLPSVVLEAAQLDRTKSLDSQQINPSSIFAYFDIRGLGQDKTEDVAPPITHTMKRQFNALKWLGYWDTYKQYYSNKQEGIGAVIHNPLERNDVTILTAYWYRKSNSTPINLATATEQETPSAPEQVYLTNSTYVEFEIEDYERLNIDSIYLWLRMSGVNGRWYKATELFAYNEINESETTLTFSGFVYANTAAIMFASEIGEYYIDESPTSIFDTAPQISTFPLKNIDNMKKTLLTAFENSITIDEAYPEAPYNLALKSLREAEKKPLFSMQSKQEGLGLKTYQSDMFQNWLSTEWVSGDNGVNAITAVQVDEEGKFTIDQFNLQRKLYNLMNRIVLSGATYDDWQVAIWGHDRYRQAENPMYIGGLSKELIFQEVVSNNTTTDSGGEPLGTLAGRGTMSKKHKGGEIYVKIDEPSYIMGLISITPRIDYSQGNKWDNDLDTMDDLHKPELDQIGFTDLVTDHIAYWDTKITGSGQIIRNSIGKVPAWMNYMTNVNRVYGAFAEQDDQMYMVLNRRYEPKWEGDEITIKDATTYIDPSKFNHIFADTRLDAMNFWTQWSVDITARRKMSAKIIPNL